MLIARLWINQSNSEMLKSLRNSNPWETKQRHVRLRYKNAWGPRRELMCCPSVLQAGSGAPWCREKMMNSLVVVNLIMLISSQSKIWSGFGSWASEQRLTSQVIKNLDCLHLFSVTCVRSPPMFHPWFFREWKNPTSYSNLHSSSHPNHRCK